MSKRVVLVILDGWGIGKKDASNPIYSSDLPNFRRIKGNFPSASLQASGISVGLPWGEEGNSEVGHINIGTGRIVYQHYPKITLAVRNNTFFENPVLKKAFDRAKKNNASVNLVGLLSEGNVHSSIEHLQALLKFAEKENVSVNLHLFTDGRDSAPTSAWKLLNQLPLEKVASLCGRFIAMDRDGHYERVERAYKMLLGDAPVIQSSEIEAHLKKTYAKKLNDEYIDPVLIEPARPLKENDSVIFFNFRKDRMRELVRAFTESDFKEFPVSNPANVYFASMTNYGKDKEIKTEAAFPDEKPENPLGKVLAQNGKTQFRISETQKYPHITYFFNGLQEEPFKNEYRILIPSNPVLRQSDDPKMRAAEITQRAVEAVEEKVYDFILINFANPDMVGHTGGFRASQEAVKVIDDCIGKLMAAALAGDAVLIITSDHGNIENVMNPLTGEHQTQHDPNPVPIYFVAKEWERSVTPQEIARREEYQAGILADIAPTVLFIMGMDVPAEMTGQNLLKAIGLA